MASAEVTAAYPRVRKFSAGALALIALAIVVVIVAAGYGSAQLGVPLTGSWGITIGSVIVMLAAIGLKIHDRLGGALIDEKNLMSLSRFQLVVWTVLIVASIVALALARGFGEGNAFGFTIPDPLWQLLGITAGGAVGKEVVNSVKKRQEVTNPEVASTNAAEALNANAQGEQRTDMQEVEAYRTGTLYGNPKASNASFVDMFQGVEVGNTAYVDISKVQMFFFTIGALVAYGADVFRMFAKTEAAAITTLPEIGSGLLAILAVSHATYIGAKAIDHTNVAASDGAQAKANAAKAAPTDDPAELDG
jgi:hypothetical protein